jgi:hypothetical protein
VVGVVVADGGTEWQHLQTSGSTTSTAHSEKTVSSTTRGKESAIQCASPWSYAA